jgi:AraC-like DNA-binding protein
MNEQELVDKLIGAWNRQSVADVLSLMDPNGTYHDSFWGETCSGRDLVRYLDTTFKEEGGWYEQQGEVIISPTGLIFRYIAYDREHAKKRRVIYQGAEIVTVVDGVITGISDIYCDPNPVQLLEVASKIEERRNHSNVALLGLSARTSGYIRRRLTELAENTTVFVDRTVTARQLADRVGCTVAHLLHVLEQEQGTSFAAFVNKRRVEFAATLLADAPDGAIDIKQIAEKSGFENVEDFDTAFQSTFGMSAADFTQQCEQQNDTQSTGTHRIF